MGGGAALWVGGGTCVVLRAVGSGRVRFVPAATKCGPVDALSSLSLSLLPSPSSPLPPPPSLSLSLLPSPSSPLPPPLSLSLSLFPSPSPSSPLPLPPPLSLSLCVCVCLSLLPPLLLSHPLSLSSSLSFSLTPTHTHPSSSHTHKTILHAVETPTRLLCSYLGYGLMAARAKVIETGRGGGKGHPCFAKGSKIKYTYGDKEYPVGEVVESGDFERCAEVALKALDHDKDCGQPKVGVSGV